MKSKQIGIFSLIAFLTLTGHDSFASRSILYSNTSANFPVSLSLSKDLSLKDSDGKPITLTHDGYLIKPGENQSGMSPDDLKKRLVTKIEIGYDDSSKKSYVGLMAGVGLLSASREVKFGLPNAIAIDSEGKPQQDVATINSDASSTGQGLSLSMTLSNGNPSHVAYDQPQSCQVEVDSIVCGAGDHDHHGDSDDHHGDDHEHCHQVQTFFPGSQNCHTEGDTWTDSYSITIDVVGSASFDVNYSTVGTLCDSCHL